MVKSKILELTNDEKTLLKNIAKTRTAQAQIVNRARVSNHFYLF